MLCIGRPVFQTPAPLGPHAVGTTTIRLEAGPAAPGGPAVRIWYPADQAAGRDLRWAPYWRREWRRPRSNDALATTRSLLDAPLAATPDRLPVLVFLPGWGAGPEENTTLLQDLASRGYVVAAPDAWDPAGYPDDPQAAADLGTPLDLSSTATLAATLAAGERNARRQARLATRVLEAITRLDATGLNATGPGGRFGGRLDLGRVGIFGFSFGGGVVAEVARADPRFKAALSLDGWVFTDAYEAGFAQPYLLVASPPPPPGDLTAADAIRRRDAEITYAEDERARAFLARHGGTLVTIAGARHGNFTDGPLKSPLRGKTDAGPINALRARAVIAGLTAGFFDLHLRGGGARLAAGTDAAVPEAKVEVWTPATTGRANASPVRPGLADPGMAHAIIRNTEDSRAEPNR